MSGLVLLTACLLTLPGCVRADEVGFEVRVVSALDGDSLEVERAGKVHRLEIAEIDCPELEQPFGEEALAMTRRLAKGVRAVIALRQLKLSGELIASVRLPDGRDLAAVLVRSGLAWWIGSADDAGAESVSPLAGLERLARLGREGLWQDPEPLPPWGFRGDPSPWPMPAPRARSPQSSRPPRDERSAGAKRAPPGRSCRPRSECCRICDRGAACGNSCISRKLQCHKGRGCACDSYEVC